MKELKSTPEEAAEYALEHSMFPEEITDDDIQKCAYAPFDEIPNTKPTEETQPKKKQSFRDKFLPFLPRTKLTFYALILIFSSIFLLCAVYLGKYFTDAHNSANNYDQLANLKDQATQGTLATDPTAPTDPFGSTGPTIPGETTPPVMLPDMQVIYELNSDLVGWIQLPKLKIDYPVMQTPNNRDFYLYRDFYKQPSDIGCLYIRENCDVFRPSDNIVIYGHAMKTGDMFGRLYNYRTKAFWEQNQYFTFDTLYERHTYQIFAVFLTSGTQRDKDGNPVGYPYHRLNDFADAAAFDQFIADIKGAAFTGENAYVGKSLYDTGITPVYGDKLVCLSTCEYTIDNGRLVIMGVQVS